MVSLYEELICMAVGDMLYREKIEEISPYSFNAKIVHIFMNNSFDHPWINGVNIAS